VAETTMLVMLRIFHSKHIPFGSYAAINLFGFIIVKKGIQMRWVDIHHELIHSRQQAEMLWIPFYTWYVIEWMVKLLKYRNLTKAYYNISFEREAYMNQYDIKYLRRRRWYSWMRYLSKKSLR
jgi:hypothetical protein